MRRQRLLGGLLVRRERWSLSLWGKLLLLVIVSAVLWGLLRGIHSFLTVNNGGSAEVLVVEGWISTRRIEQAAVAFQKGRYRCVVVVRDVYDVADKWASGRYSADYVAADLVQHGVPNDLVHTLFCPVVHKDRTYHCALAVRQFLGEKRIAAQSIDVATLATHTRRSRLLYEKAFNSGMKVGAIALDDPAYDPAHWWRTSEGVREVPFEFLAYLYARFLFHP